MDQAIQIWRITFGIDDVAFQSLINILSPHGFYQESGTVFPTISHSFTHNANDVTYLPEVVSSYPSTSWQTVPNALIQAGSGLRTQNAGAIPAYDMVSEPGRSQPALGAVQREENVEKAYTKCWAQKKKVNIRYT